MQISFHFKGVKYMLNFEDPDCINREDGLRAVQLRVYYSLEPDSLYSASLKEIKDNKIVWGKWDDHYLPKDAQHQCDRLIGLLAFV